MKKVTIFFFDGCPNYEPTVELIRQVLAELDVDAVVESVEVKGSDDAERLRFFGSPTVHGQGSDIDPEAEGRRDYGFSCRRYVCPPHGASGTPCREMVADALKKIAEES